MKLYAPILFCLFGLLNKAAFAQTVTRQLNPAGTYLRTNNDPGSLFAVPIALLNFGIQSGSLIRIERLGFEDGDGPGPEGDTYGGLSAVFSGSSTLLSASLINRVQNAIDAGTDYTSQRTFDGNLITDIPEDFSLGAGTLDIVVPTGATHIFFSVRSPKFGDDIDPNGDFGVRVTVIPEPSSVLLLLSSAALCLRRRFTFTHERNG